MNVLTTDNIITVLQQVHPDTHIHPTSIAYIRTLLRPYAEVVDPAPIEGVIQWIPLAFPGELAKHALSELLRVRILNVRTLQKPETDPAVETAAKDSIIDYIVAELLELAGNYARDKNDMILPWDIQLVISRDEELSAMFHINIGDTTLSVTVTVGAKQFTHVLGLEFTIGLLLFSLPTVGNHDFKIMMFDTAFTEYYLVGDEDYVIAEDEHSHRFLNRNNELIKHSVIVNDTRYWFNDTDFMQGFATGALWTGVDHHAYWRDLTQHDNGVDEDVQTKITF